MKKIITSSIAASLSVIDFSSFKNAKFVQTSYYWFKVPAVLFVPLSTTHLTLLTLGGTSTYKGFLQQSQITGVTCSPGTLICIVGYTFGSIHGFTAGGTPTQFKLIPASGGVPKPWTTLDQTSQD